MDVDCVIAWVDGNDPNWQRVKREYRPSSSSDSDGENRYRDWGLLPFWFRAVEKCMPWVRTIHFVTWGHVPPFLNTQAQSLHIIKHEEFIPAEYLPTFSSHTIELNIHRIPGLSEHFIYFNDDMFPLRPIQPTYFFHNSLPCTCGMEAPLILSGKAGVWQHAMLNDIGMINKYFPKKTAVQTYRKKYRANCYRWIDNLRTLALEVLYPHRFLGFYNIHGPNAYLKSVFCEVWKHEFDVLRRTCLNKYRTNDDVNQWIMLWWQVASGQFSPVLMDNIVNSITENSIDDLCRMIEMREHDFICLNDPDEYVPYEILASRLQNAFLTVFPDKSSFEK